MQRELNPIESRGGVVSGRVLLVLVSSFIGALIALALCWVAGGRYDALATLSTCRSVDFAAGQLIVSEAGGVVAMPDAGGDVAGTSLDLATRTRVLAAAHPAMLERLLPIGAP